jgi:hypothetical protein
MLPRFASWTPGVAELDDRTLGPVLDGAIWRLRQGGRQRGVWGRSYRSGWRWYEMLELGDEVLAQLACLVEVVVEPETLAQLSRNARAPHHSPETTANVLRLAALRLASKGKDKSIKWTFERIADELGLSRDQVAGIIGRERRCRKAWRSAAAMDRNELE